MTYHRLCS